MEVEVITSTEHDMLSIDNTPTAQVLSKYRLAGHFCSTAIKAVIQQCVPGANTTQICHFGDETILAQVSKILEVVAEIRRRRSSSRMNGELQNQRQLT